MRRTLLALALLATSSAVAAQSPFVEDPTSALAQGFTRSIAALWGDFDGDGDLDLLVTDVEAGALDILYRNEGNGLYTYIPFETNINPNITTYSGAWSDLNNDGHLDLLTVSLSGGNVLLNQGSQNGQPDFLHRWTIVQASSDQRDVAVGDYNGDGFVDALVVRRNNQPNLLLRNDRHSGAIEASGDVGHDLDNSNTACWGDVNNDGFPELYVANINPINRFYANRRGVLRRIANLSITSDVVGPSTGCAWGDMDNDGDLDLVVATDARFFGSAIYFFRNDGDSFQLIQEDYRSINTNGLAWGDIDNDGDLDLVAGNWGNGDITLYNNNGTGDFSIAGFGDGYNVIALTLVDDDEDGDLDLFISNGGFDFQQRNQLFRNVTDGAQNWLEVDLRRMRGRNRFGVGAHIYAYATIDGTSRTLLRPVSARPSRYAQDGYRVHFGLGDAAVVDSLVVDWPRGVDEDRTVLYDVAVNQIITVTGAAVGDDVAEARAEASTPASFAVEGVYPNPSYRDFTVTVRSAGDSPVRVEVLDVLGRRVRVLEGEGVQGTPVHVYWDGADAAGRPVAGGPYVLRVRQGADEEVVKVTLLR